MEIKIRIMLCSGLFLSKDTLTLIWGVAKEGEGGSPKCFLGFKPEQKVWQRDRTRREAGGPSVQMKLM